MGSESFRKAKDLFLKVETVYSRAAYGRVKSEPTSAEAK